MTRTTRHDSSVPVPVPAPGSPAVRASGSGSRRAAAAVLAGVLLLAGCTGGEPEPEESELPLPASVTASPSASASPEPSEEAEADGPERPAAMDKKDADGAAAAAEYFLSLYDYMLTTGDSSRFESMSHRACGFCTATLDRLDWLEENDATFTGGAMTTTIEESYEIDAATGIFPLDVVIEQESIEILDADGTSIDEVDHSTREARIEMALRDKKWVVVTVTHRPE